SERHGSSRIHNQGVPTRVDVADQKRLRRLLRRSGAGKQQRRCDRQRLVEHHRGPPTVIIPDVIEMELEGALLPPPMRVAAKMPPPTAAAPTPIRIFHFRAKPARDATSSTEFCCAILSVAVWPFLVAVTLILKRPISLFGVNVSA